MGNLALEKPEEIRIYNMVDMGLRFSGMIRLYEKGSKFLLIDKILGLLPKIFNAYLVSEFDMIHDEFCEWATESIYLAEKRKNGFVIKKRKNISYGQAGKTLDVVFKVLIYYCNWPNQRKSRQLRKWIHAAVDNKMMQYLKQRYPTHFKSWPSTVEEVDKDTYIKLQDLVKQYNIEFEKEIKLPVEFDDKYWYILKSNGVAKSK